MRPREAPGTIAGASVDLSGEQLRIVVLGDSVATAFGTTTTSWPEEMRQILTVATHRPVTVRTFALHVQTAERSLRRNVTKTAALAPAVVVVAHGGAEALLTSPGYLQRSEVGTSAVASCGTVRGVARDLSWQMFLRLLQLHPPGLERFLGRIGIRPRSSSEAFAATYAELVFRLLEDTSAHLVLLRSCGGLQRGFPFSKRTIDANDALIGSVHGRLRCTGRTSVVSPRRFMDLRQVLLDDGAHLNDTGHAQLGQAVAIHILDRLADLETAPLPSTAAHLRSALPATTS